MVVRSKNRPNALRGWAVAAPRRGRERRELYARCGPQCFLLPGQLKFPVCASLRVSKGCRVDRRALVAARIRAKRWNYPVVYQRAIFLQRYTR